ncbi:MAG: NAD(P)/FAD-dependent oxidoreductase [Sulfurovum sp.]
MNRYDVIVVGAGASGMMSAITSAHRGKSVLILEKLSKIGIKLKATGGGRCNLTNTLPNDEFMSRFGKYGRFMTPALNLFNYKKLIEFLESIGVPTHAPDGYRIFPTTHNSSTVINAMSEEMSRLGVEILCSQKVESLLYEDNQILGVKTKESSFYTQNVIIASGGLGYPNLGAEGDGYSIVQEVGHKVTNLYPAMMPLKSKEDWVGNCRADTIAKVEIRVDIKKYKKLSAIGDLIFTKNGIRGPVVLDFSREITPLLDKFEEVPIVMNLTKGLNEEQIRQHFKKTLSDNTLQLLETLLPKELSLELCKLAQIDPNIKLSIQKGINRDRLISLLAWTPLTINGHDGFKMAMITRGGVSLKEIDPNTMGSRIIKGLYMVGELVDIDGPCGGFNLQWAFASGYLAGELRG